MSTFFRNTRPHSSRKALAGQGNADSVHAFGRTANSVIRLTREDSWTWGTLLSRELRDRHGMTIAVNWSAQLVAEGQAKDLLARYSQKQGIAAGALADR